MRAEHPDRGGDPAVFAAGLARFDQALHHAGRADAKRSPASAEPAPRVVVTRQPRGGRQRLQHAVRHLVHLVGRHPSSPRAR